MMFPRKTQTQIKGNDGNWRDLTEDKNKPMTAMQKTEYRELEYYEGTPYKIAWYETDVYQYSPKAEILPVGAVFEWVTYDIAPHARTAALKRIGTVMCALIKLQEISPLYKGNEMTGLTSIIGKKCIVRTYADGVWYGIIGEKDGNEVIIYNARRMQFWKAKEGITISAVALYGIDINKSTIIESVEKHWTQAIGITQCTDTAINSIEGAPHVKAR